MLKRLLLGLIEGLLLGGALAAVLVQVLGMPAFEGTFSAYLAAVATGALTGLVAGRPIWRKGASLEAGLKAVAGMALSAGLLFVIRRWLKVELDLSVIGAGRGTIGTLPVAILPLLSTALSVVFELDNNKEEGRLAPPTKTRVLGERRADPAVEQASPEETGEAPSRRQARH
jgi:hypothetical protein